MELLQQCITQENITFILALIGSLGTILSGIYNFISRRVNVDISFHGYIESKKSLLVYVSLINKSCVPVSITDITFTKGDCKYYCKKTPKRVYHQTFKENHEIVSHFDYYNLEMPIVLQGLAGTSGYVYFEIPLESFQIDTSNLIFEVSTNRHKIIQTKLLFDKVPRLHKN